MRREEIDQNGKLQKLDFFEYEFSQSWLWNHVNILHNYKTKLKFKKAVSKNWTQNKNNEPVVYPVCGITSQREFQSILNMLWIK